MTAVKELIDLPELVHRPDFVVRLTERIERPEETLRQHAVTPQLATCFDGALAFLRRARDAHALSVPELAPVIAKHEAWMAGKRFDDYASHLSAGDCATTVPLLQPTRYAWIQSESASR